MTESSTILLVAVFHDRLRGGLVIDDQLRDPGDTGDGEIGHLKVDTTSDARMCSCRRRGHVDAYVTPIAIMRELAVSSWRHAVDLPASGIALDVFEDAGTRLGLAIGIAVRVGDPDVVLVYLPHALVRSGSGPATAAYSAQLRQTMEDDGFPTSATAIVLRPLPLDETAAERCVGHAATMLLHRLIANPRGDDSEPSG